MISARPIARRLAAGLAAVGIGCGLAVAAAGAAQAAPSDPWGFAFVNKPTVPGLADLSYQAGSWTSGKVHVTPGVTGQDFVRFPKIGSKGGVVHVTAVTDQPVWCQAQKWRPVGPNEVVAVRCYHAGGTPHPVYVPFTVMFSKSSGKLAPPVAYAYVHHTGAGVTSSFNSSGSPNIVDSLGTGVWAAHLHGLGTATATGSVQVTAVNQHKPAKCEVGARAWSASEQIILVRCYNGLSAPMATGWTLSYQRGRAITGTAPHLFAYTVDNKPLIPGPYAPAPAAVNFNSQAGINTIQKAGTGQALVKFPRVGLRPNTVLVTAAGSGGRFCNLNTLWGTTGGLGGPGSVTVRDVTCYTASGAMANTKSFVTYTSKS